jgi:cellulose synthase/poly-beta-1,6-N-acetylglucosamine synthase-like glycosyltransferase
MLISGALAVFRRDVLVEVGGYDPDCVGEDFELVMRIHRHMMDKGREYRRTHRHLTDKRSEYSVHFVADQVAWKEVPVTLGALRAQRQRWHRGLAESLWRHRGMLLRPQYGRFGMVTLPYYWAFELISPVLELMALVVLALGFALGVVSTPYVMLFLAVVYGYATVVTLVTLTVEEVTFHKYSRWSDLAAMVLASVLESFGYRQLTACGRLEGLLLAPRVDGPLGGTGFPLGHEDDSRSVEGLKGDADVAAFRGDG